MRNIITTLFVFAAFIASAANIRIINNGGIYTMAVRWQSLATSLGHTATIEALSILNNNTFFATADILIVSDGIQSLSPTQISTIQAFLETGKSVYLQGEYQSLYSGNQAFSQIVNAMGGNFTWGSTQAGDLDPTISGSLSTLPNSISSLPYFWYGVTGTTTSPRVLPFVFSSSTAPVGWMYDPQNNAHGRLITTTDQDWIQQANNDPISLDLMENILYHLEFQNEGDLGVGATATPNPICPGETLQLAASGGDTYSWQGPNGFTSSSDSPTIGNIQQVNSGVYTVTVTSGGNPTVVTLNVTVKPQPDVLAIPATQGICNAETISAIILSGSVSGTTYSWVRDNTGTVTGIAGSGSGNISGALTNVTNAAVTVTFTITPTADGCTGTPITSTVIVSPQLNVDDVEDQELCNSELTEEIIFSGGASGANYTWTNNNTTIGLAANGVGDIPSFTGVNNGNTPVTSTITVTPSMVVGFSETATFNYTGQVQTWTVPAGVTQIQVDARGGAGGSNQNYQGGNGGRVITIINVVPGEILDIFVGAEGLDDVESAPAVYNGGGGVFSYISNGTSGTGGGGTDLRRSPFGLSNRLVVAGGGGGAGYQSIGGNGGDLIAQDGVPFPSWPNSGGKAGTQSFGGAQGIACCSCPTYTTPGSIGLGGNGAGDGAGGGGGGGGYYGGGGSCFAGGGGGSSYTEPAANSITHLQGFQAGNGQLFINYSSTLCTGTSEIFTITVNPSPVAIATPSSQTICSSSAISAISLSSGLSGTAFAWTRDNTATVTGIAASGSGNISGTLTNSTSAPVTVTFTITPTANGCAGAPITATVLVNPTPNAVATPSAQTICSASSITTIVLSSAVSGTAFAWTRDNTATVTGIAASGSGNISGTLTNTTNAPVLVTFTVTPSVNGCTGPTTTATVLVNPLPTYIFTSNGLPYSEGDTITACHQDVLALTITSPTSLTYSFKRLSNGNVISSGTTPAAFNYTATNAREGYYEISVTNALGCNLKDTIYLLVNALPNPTATATPNPICQGGNLQLGVNGNNNFGFAWSGPNGFTSNVKNPLISGITPAGTGTYVVTVTNLNGCSDTSSINVLVNPTPTAIATPASQTICSAGTITTIVLTGAVSGTIYNWTRNNTATVTGIAASGSGNISGTLTNTTSAPVTVTFTITPTANGCTGLPITATVLVNPTPNAVATPASQTICSATAITTIALTGSVTGTTYTWTRDNTATVTGIAASGSGNISGTLTNTTNAPVLVTFTVTPTANGCTGAAITATVLINPTSNVIATPASQAICSGTSITTIVLSGAVSGTTYNWTRNNTATVTGIAASGSGNISGAMINNTSAPVTVTFTITPSANGCAGTPVTATVVVNPLPVGTISIAPNPACVGSTVQLSATGGVLYAWSGPQGFVSTAQNPTILLTSHLQQGKYIVTITSSAGCSVIKFAELTVFYPPVATATYETSTACTGSTLILHGTGAGSYSWTGPAGFISSKPDPEIPSVTAANSGLYTLIVTSPNGCSATTTVNVTINNPPALSANPTLTQTCEGSSIQLFATGSGDFVWHGPATYTSTQQNPVIDNIPIHLSGTYTVELTASTGCVSTASVAVKVYDQIHAFASASADTICEGQSLQLHAEGGSTYLWNGPAGFFSTESDPRIDNITLKHSGKYYVYMSNEGGCFGYAELSVFVKPAAKGSAYATPNPVIENNPVQFFASSTGVAYAWSGPLGFTSSEQNPSIKKVTRYMAGIYTVTITNENDCPTVVKVNLRVLFTNKGGQTITGDGEEELTTRSEVAGTIYPNPTNDILYFDTKGSEAIEYVIYDVNGRVQMQKMTTVDNYISTNKLSSGVYQIRWRHEGSKEWNVNRFVKIR